jgi:2-polyprenyl-6-methoxyphenol hydroxylase-like FAD-dependent oxidoreductase
MTRSPLTAVVIGGNLAGCLTGQVLSTYCQRVVILEKGDFDDEVGVRRSVPQEHHVHLLLLRGKQILEEIFPGLLADLDHAGAVIADLGHDVKWYQYGHWKNRYRTSISAHYCSRRLIDNTVRRRIRQNPCVSVMSRARVTGLLPSGGRVAGVEYEQAGGTHRLAADFVVDASGRGSRVSQWLAALLPGVTIAEEHLETKLGYASRIYKSLAQYRHLWKVMLVLPMPPRQRAMGVISPIEGDRWLVTTGGWFGHYPKPDPDDFLKFLSQLPTQDIYDVVRRAEPLSEVFGFGMSGSVRRRYDQVANWPPGFLVVGDALCSLNPLYSQGMTLVAMEVRRLRDCMRQLCAGTLSTRDVQRQIGEVVIPAWSMAVEEDMRFPETDGPRALRMKVRHWYGARLGRLSATHRLALQTQVAVTNLVAPASQLYRPGILGPLIFEGLREAIRVNGDS